MKNNYTSLMSLAMGVVLVCGCVSCSVNNSNKGTSLDDELGDTVPASEFELVEDTANAPAAGDTIVAKKDGNVGKVKNEE